MKQELWTRLEKSRLTGVRDGSDAQDDRQALEKEVAYYRGVERALYEVREEAGRGYIDLPEFKKWLSLQCHEATANLCKVAARARGEDRSDVGSTKSGGRR